MDCSLPIKDCLILTNRQAVQTKLNREIPELNDIINQLNLTAIYRTFYLNMNKYTLFSAAHGTFSNTFTHSKAQQMQGQWNKPCILADHGGLKLNNNRNKRKLTNSRKLNNSLRNEKWVKTDIKKEIKNFLELMKMKTQCTQVYRTRWRGFYECNF